jgi:hypothetical protein
LVIKASTGKAVDALIADLASDRAVKRETATARLTVIGARAVDRLVTLAASRSAPSAARVAAFRSLEGIADPRALAPALVAFADNDTAIVLAALGVARAFLRSPRGMKALDHVTAVALDRNRPVPVRLAALRALSDLEPATVQPIVAALKTDPHPELAAVFDPPPRKGVKDAGQQLADAAAGRLPLDAAVLRRAIARASTDAPISVLHQVVEQVRVREGSEPPARRADWMAVRAAAHAALAGRGSRLALYDLRETIESARGPLAVEFLAAVTAIGDATCLEPLAGAYARAATGGTAPGDWWGRHLAEAFRAIIRREKITRRHAVARKIEKRWPGAFESLVVSR